MVRTILCVYVTKTPGGEFWTKGYFISTVGRHGSEDIIGQYIKNQGTEKKYKKLHSQQVQLELF
jgi:putative transposase